MNRSWLEAICTPPTQETWDKIIRAVTNSDRARPKYSRSRTRFCMLLDGRTPPYSAESPRLSLAHYLIHWSRKIGLDLHEERSVVFWGIVKAGWTPGVEPETSRTLAALLSQARNTYVDYTLRKSQGRPDKSHLRMQALLTIVTADYGPAQTFSVADTVAELACIEDVPDTENYRTNITRMLKKAESRGWVVHSGYGKWKFIVDKIPDHKNPSRELQRQHTAHGFIITPCDPEPNSIDTPPNSRSRVSWEEQRHGRFK